MPRYFFTIRRPGRDDPHGTDLPDVPAARPHAERKIRELRKVMIVKDEARKMVLSLPFLPGC